MPSRTKNGHMRGNFLNGLKFGILLTDHQCLSMRSVVNFDTSFKRAQNWNLPILFDICLITFRDRKILVETGIEMFTS